MARRLPDARVVKALNTHGAEVNLSPEIAGVQVDGFLCGDDPDARAQISRLIEDLGMAPVDLGPLQQARVLKAIAVLWIHQAMVAKRGREIVVKVMG